MLRGDVIQALIDRIGARSYLEIGVQEGRTFDAVRCERKVSVDPQHPATFRGTSDQFFESLRPADRFDVVFVDGDHGAEQALRDLRSAVAHLTIGGAVVAHDCSPPTAAYEHPGCCGTAWRAWLAIRRELPLTRALVVDTDLGCGVLLPGLRGRPIPEDVDVDALTWKDLDARRAELLGLVSVPSFLYLVARLPPIIRRGS